MEESKIDFAVIQRLNPKFNKHMDNPEKIAHFNGRSNDPKISKCKGALLWALASGEDADIRGMLAVYQIIDVEFDHTVNPHTYSLYPMKHEHREQFARKPYRLQVTHLQSYSPNAGSLCRDKELVALFQVQGLQTLTTAISETLQRVLAPHRITVA